MPRTAGLLALSPRLVLLALPDFAGTDRIVEAVLTGPAGQLEPPLSWQSLTLPEGRIHVLLTRMQPGLVPNAALQLSAAGGLTIRLTLEAAEDTEALLGSAEPGVLLALLRFLVAKALGAIRAAGDAELAQFCRRLAAAASATARTAQAVARCGRDALAWSLPGDAVPGVHILLAPHRMHRMVLADGPAILPDCGAHEAWLLPPGGGTLIHLPAPPRLPSLGQLGRGKDLRGRALHRAAQAELARRAAVEPAMQRLLRDQQLLQPTLPMHRHAAPDFPLGASLDLAVPDQAGGLFLRGWLRDPLGLVGSLTLVGPYGEQRLAPAALQRFPRPDLVKEFATAPHGGADCQAGFALHLPEGAARPAAQFRLRLGLTTGDEMTLVAPPGLLHPQAARDAILGAIAPAHATAALMARAIAPPVERLHALVMAGRGAPEVIRMGDAPRAPIASLVVPLYRNLRFLRHQLGAFARDPALREAELIYVLDSPEQRDEVEQMLRGMHRLYRLPLVLVVQPRNHGYGAACHAGVAEAGAPVLLLLNSDVVPATRNWLAPMLTALKRQRKLAAVGPKLLFEDGSLQHAGLYFLQMDGEAEWFNDHYFKGHPRHWPAAQVARRVPGITGAAFCVRAEAWKAVGGISTDYVIGDYEDSDLCLRLRAAGGEIGYIPQSELFHFERQSIRDHGGYARSLASTYNRTLHHRRWAPEIAALMARQARAERR
ncbi:glycosyltransferase family 2 protein [Dankookia rubra]|uniref:Glycosyltransferase family 2 protein n=1 Tax=Dankookia rubra TaxID=1442381 RepID=A0A4R5QNK0_9PROT|nr:glycosyltransferase family 2 protein [Dankookia rubra]TDH64419.1 glycosyltransferase family 2 protein [Dankookia rubra]